MTRGATIKTRAGASVKPTATQKLRHKRQTHTAAEYLSQQMALSGKTLNEIAEDLGYENANMISMIKLGKTKLPIAKIAPMAKSLGVDPVNLFRIVMQEYHPETWEAIEDTILNHAVISDNEFEIIQVIRESRVPNPKIRNDADRRIIQDAISKLKPENF